MTTTPYNKETKFAAHESMQTASRAFKELRDRYGSNCLLFGGDKEIDHDRVLIIEADLGDRGYLRILPQTPRLNRSCDVRLYLQAKPFGWTEKHNGLVVINSAFISRSGLFAKRYPGRCEPNHEHRFANALASMLNEPPPYRVRTKERGQRSHRQYFVS